VASSPKDVTVASATFAPFRLSWRICMSLLILWFVSVATHMTYVRWHQLDAAPHMEGIIGYYVDAAGNNPLLEKVATKTYWLVFEATQAQSMLSKPAGEGNTLGKAVRRAVWAGFEGDLAVAGYATVLFGIKLAIMALAAPLFVILMAVAVIDGGVQRFIRKACGGMESAAIYHRAKLYGVLMLPPFAATLFLCVPVAFDPAWIYVPTAVLSAILLRFQMTYYKKYV
jgi:integrating conjugative element membrane protein (TIGR03747 family)